MAVKITFLLTVKPEKFDDVVANLKRIETVEVLEAGNGKGDLVCVATVADDHSERAANICSSVCNMKDVDKVGIFVNVIPEPEPEPSLPSIKERFVKPLVPMIISSVVTFFLVYSAVVELKVNWNWYDMFNYAAVPALVTFLSQFGMEHELWRAGSNVKDRIRRR